MTVHLYDRCVFCMAILIGDWCTCNLLCMCACHAHSSLTRTVQVHKTLTTKIQLELCYLGFERKKVKEMGTFKHFCISKSCSYFFSLFFGCPGQKVRDLSRVNCTGSMERVVASRCRAPVYRTTDTVYNIMARRSGSAAGRHRRVMLVFFSPVMLMEFPLKHAKNAGFNATWHSECSSWKLEKGIIVLDRLD